MTSSEKRRDVGIFRKIIARDNVRRSRFHDTAGNFVDLAELLYLPLVVQRFIARYFFDRLYIEPWWTFRIKKRVSRILTPESNVVEFGFGHSTLWLARNAGKVLSIENDPAWYERVSRQNDELGLSNVTLVLREGEDYADVGDIPDGSVNFCVIDGMYRARCARAMPVKMKPGGWIYLDNTDWDIDAVEDGENLPSAVAYLQRTVGEQNIERYTGFTIGSINTHQGSLFRCAGDLRRPPLS
jgi:hypothetical protein